MLYCLMSLWSVMDSSVRYKINGKGGLYEKIKFAEICIRQ